MQRIAERYWAAKYNDCDFDHCNRQAIDLCELCSCYVCVGCSYTGTPDPGATVCIACLLESR
jgi:hypothetical protein